MIVYGALNTYCLPAWSFSLAQELREAANTNSDAAVADRMANMVLNDEWQFNMRDDHRQLG
uniref:Uncharacterized protein n=1 Tax=Romanomermis culicivorax TaxID=13658 RepID=A0A915JA10_ROMCU